MSTTYQTADDVVTRAVTKIMKQYHAPLANAGVTVRCLFAVNSTDAPAVKHGGYPALATIKINSLQNRVEGKCDATMVIDEVAWKEMSDEEQEALVDHELEHLTLAPAKKKKGKKRKQRDPAEKKFIGQIAQAIEDAGVPMENVTVNADLDDSPSPVQLDDVGRPKLKIVLHDWQLGGFYSVAERHPGVAHEARAVVAVEEKLRQGTLAFA